MKNKKKIISLCREFMESNGIAYDEGDFEQKIILNLYNDKVLTDTELGLSEISVALAKVDNEIALKNVEKKLVEDNENLIMLILTSSVQYQKKIEQVISRRKNDNSNIKVLMTGIKEDEKKYTVRIVSRIQALYDEIEVPKSRKISERVNGYVYSAYLKDIVNIYDEMGDELFKKNVRLRVKKDSIGVGKEIKDTLRDNPNQFWFFNNGITIVSNKAIDLAKSDCILLEKKGDVTFSVVNGAQTIAAAHEFLKCDSEKAENIKNAEDALVLLRIVSVEERDANNEEADCNTESMSEKISKALNRQKPIEAEDLAYYSPFVKSVNKLYKEVLGSKEESEVDNRYFCVIRRGENENDSESNFEHSLTLIARAIRASGYFPTGKTQRVYTPWKAVNTYNADILKMNDQDLKHVELFKTALIADNKEEYLKNYQYINLAIYLYKRFGELKKEINLTEYKNKARIEVFKESGSWYFITFFFEFILQNSKDQRLKSNCIIDFNDIISKNDLVEMIKFFFTVMDKEGEFKLKDLRQEDTYKDIKKLIKSHLSKQSVYADKAQQLLISYKEGDRLSYSAYEASLLVKGDRFILKTGSRIETEVSDNCSMEVKRLREENESKIKMDGIITEDIEFDDLSLAAKFVEGRRLVKGYKNWSVSE